MTTYRVVGRTKPRDLTLDTDEWRISQALAMREKYGLHHVTVTDIITRWEDYSDSYAAGWLVDSKESIEEVFGVVLEEVNAAE